MATEAPKPREPHPKTLELSKSLPQILCAALWQLRHKLPDMTLQITVEEIEKFERSLAYNEQKPKLAVLATHDRLVVCMTDATGSQIIQSESTEDDLKRKEALQERALLVSNTNSLVSEHRAMLARGEDSESIVRELHNACLTMAKMLQP